MGFERLSSGNEPIRRVRWERRAHHVGAFVCLLEFNICFFLGSFVCFLFGSCWIWVLGGSSCKWTWEGGGRHCSVD